MGMGGHGSDGKLTCQAGSWVMDHPGSCVRKTCNTGGAYSTWACREMPSAPWTTPVSEPTYGTECKVTCLDKSEFTQVCDVSAGGAPKMVISSGKACATTTSIPRTTAEATSTETTAAPTTTIPAPITTTASQKTYISHSVAITQDFGSQTGADLMRNIKFQASLKGSLVAGLEAASPDLSSLSTDNIMIKHLTLTPVRRLGAAAGRRLAMSKLTVDYAIEVPNTMASQVDSLGTTIASNTDAFNAAMAEKYIALEKGRTGSEPIVTVAASKEITIETPVPTERPVETATIPGSVVPSSPKPSSSPTAEKDEDNVGTIVGSCMGAVAGISLLAFLLYMYKKRKSEE